MSGRDRDWLARQVGGHEALAQLSLEPLPNEPFEWSVVPAEVHDTVADVLAWLDKVLDAEFDDVELRTAGRRLLARVVAGDPDLLGRRNANPAHTAAALAYLVVGSNGLFDLYRGMFAKDLAKSFGIPGIATTRADAFLVAAKLPPRAFDETSLPLEMLTSTRRAALLDLRDRSLTGRRRS